MRTFEELRDELENCGKIPVFEVEVIDKRTNATDYIIFDVSFFDGKIRAEHVRLTEKQVQSNKIAFVAIEVDPDFSLDYHLQELYDECINAVVWSDFYELSENN